MIAQALIVICVVVAFFGAAGAAWFGILEQMPIPAIASAMFFLFACAGLVKAGGAL